MKQPFKTVAADVELQRLKRAGGLSDPRAPLLPGALGSRAPGAATSPLALVRSSHMNYSQYYGE